MSLKTAIGLEIHVQLKTKSKMFCGCDNNAEAREPNTVSCPICMGFPGVLPVPNHQAILWTIKTALALNCRVAEFSKFDRKHYFYPDLPKNYQISQYDLPFAKNGKLDNIRIRRVHLEEDAGKLIHPEGENFSLVDFNRAGTPLMEIVTEPDITLPAEAKLFLQKLRTIIRYLDVSDADMEKGHLRCDANISIAPSSKLKAQMSNELGIPVEIKNLNSFKMVEKALLYEEKRQKDLIESGKKVTKETRGWIDEKGMTISQRGKEEVHDYRYFPEPDLPPFHFSEKDVAKIKKSLPELPDERQKRFISKFNLKEKDAKTLVENPRLADYFEEVTNQKADPQKSANWILVELLSRLHEENSDISQNKILPSELAKLINKIEKNEISSKMAKDIFVKMFETGRDVETIIKETGATLVTDKKEIESAVIKIIKKNPKACSDFKKGKRTALQFLIGKAIRETKGKASPEIIKKIIERKLNGAS